MEDTSLYVQLYEDQTGKITVVFPEVTPDEIDAFVLNYRVLTQWNDPISIGRIKLVVRELPVSADLKHEFESTVAGLNGFLDGSNDFCPKRVGTHRSFIATVLYGSIAHYSPAKYLRSEQWNQQFGHGHMQSLFVTNLRIALAWIGMLKPVAERIEKALGELHSGSRPHENH